MCFFWSLGEVMVWEAAARRETGWYPRPAKFLVSKSRELPIQNRVAPFDLCLMRKPASRTCLLRSTVLALMQLLRGQTKMLRIRMFML